MNTIRKYLLLTVIAIITLSCGSSGNPSPSTSTTNNLAVGNIQFTIDNSRTVTFTNGTGAITPVGTSLGVAIRGNSIVTTGENFAIQLLTNSVLGTYQLKASSINGVLLADNIVYQGVRAAGTTAGVSYTGTCRNGNTTTFTSNVIVTISEYNTTARTIKGTFNGTLCSLLTNVPSIQITNGAFHVKY